MSASQPAGVILSVSTRHHTSHHIITIELELELELERMESRLSRSCWAVMVGMLLVHTTHAGVRVRRQLDATGGYTAANSDSSWSKPSI